MNSTKIFLGIFCIALILFFACSIFAEQAVLHPSKSGFISSDYRYTSFSSIGSGKAKLMYYKLTGAKSPKAVQYEYFDLSEIPENSKIISAVLYKYHKNTKLGKDENKKMSPRSINNAHRVTLGILLEDFSEYDNYENSNYKNQEITDKVAMVTNSNDQLTYDVTDIVQNWVDSGEYYGFSFLGNYNTKASSTYYYLSNSNYPPRLEITYETAGSNENQNIPDSTPDNNHSLPDNPKPDNNHTSTDNDTLPYINNTLPDNPKPDNKIYVIAYIGDIDGEVSSDWYPFYQKITDFFESNKIPVSFSFYPGSMSDEGTFPSTFRQMYFSEYIELIQKGNNADSTELNMEKLPLEDQKKIIMKGQENFKNNMIKMGVSSPTLPVTYDQINGRVNEETKGIMQELGIKFYFDVFVEPDLVPLKSTDSFDSMQYGVSFATNGDAGKETVFHSPEEMIKQLKEFDLEDKSMLITINGKKVIPIWVHQQDFEDKNIESKLDEAKWATYSNTIMKLKADPDIAFVTPEQVYNLRHNSKSQPICGNGIKEESEECDDKNLVNGDGCSNQCRKEALPDPNPNYICEYASKASATSENILGSEAVYAIGSPDAPKTGNCEEWSGYGYSWTPANWDVKANLTLFYSTPIHVSNITVFGDYYMCWNSIWLKNSRTNEIRQILNNPDSSCILKKLISEDFIADTVIMETCGWQWSSTDAVQICGKPENSVVPEVDICTWKNCEKGAASISVDDFYPSCSDILESNGFRGTYYLTNTSNFDSGLWNQFNNLFLKGHEIGTHTQSHICSNIPNQDYIADVEKNIGDITRNTDVSKNDIISHAYSCGFSTPEIENIFKNSKDHGFNFLGARGYNFNQLESTTPGNFFNIRSFNSHDYPGGDLEPPDYFKVVDDAENNGKWANLVFHVECDDKGVITYLKSKRIWVDTVGNVVKYIKLRDSARISDYVSKESEISFNAHMERDGFAGQSLTLKAKVNRSPSKVMVNGNEIPFKSQDNLIIFDIDQNTNKIQIIY